MNINIQEKFIQQRIAEKRNNAKAAKKKTKDEEAQRWKNDKIK